MATETLKGAPNFAAHASTQSVRSRFIKVDGIRTHYLDAGDGPPLVLLHDGGFGGSADVSWYANLSEFASRFRVIAPDWLGFGDTAKLHDFDGGTRRRLWHMTRFLEAMDIGSAAFAGLSMGATLLLQIIAAGEPNWPIAAAIAMSGGGFVPLNEARQSMLEFDCTLASMRTLVKAMVFDPRWANDPDVADRRFHAAVQPGAWEAVTAARLRSPIAEARHEVFGVEDTTKYEQITVPTLLIAGANDKLRQPNYAPGIAARIPDCEVHVLNDCGHVPNIEHPHEVNRLVLDFLSRRYVSRL